MGILLIILSLVLILLGIFLIFIQTKSVYTIYTAHKYGIKNGQIFQVSENFLTRSSAEKCVDKWISEELKIPDMENDENLKDELSGLMPGQIYHQDSHYLHIYNNYFTDEYTIIIEVLKHSIHEFKIY